MRITVFVVFSSMSCGECKDVKKVFFDKERAEKEAERLNKAGGTTYFWVEEKPSELYIA